MLNNEMSEDDAQLPPRELSWRNAFAPERPFRQHRSEQLEQNTTARSGGISKGG
ncbi:MAG: hypothetical protein Q4D58_00630 [Synergistaceae bacterium]|nr:hypothetical protein [Synergistaceae bacterium]